MVGGKKARISAIDLVRFFCAIGILVHHYFFYFWKDDAGLGTQPRFRNGIFLVEVFLILSGYFTVKHFAKIKLKKSEESIDSRFKISIKYTFDKFKVFIPYIIIAVLLGFAYGVINDNFALKRIIAHAEALPQELSLGSGLMNAFLRIYHVPSLWYLSLLFFTLPVFCVVATIKKKYVRNWILFMFVCVYYTNYWYGGFVGVDGIIRIFAGLSLGLLLFEFTEYFKTIKLNTLAKILLQCAELFFIFYIVVNLFSRGDTIRPVTNSPYFFNMMLFSFLGLSFILSKQTFTHKINFKFTSFLGAISLPLYLLHMPIQHFINHYLGDSISFKKALVLSSITSIVISIVVYLIVRKFCYKKAAQ